MVDWFTARAKEKTTWIGVAAVLGMFGIHLSDGAMQSISDLAVAGAGLAAILMKEKGL